jgi:tryptophan 2,3-dioxygenase
MLKTSLSVFEATTFARGARSGNFKEIESDTGRQEQALNKLHKEHRNEKTTSGEGNYVNNFSHKTINFICTI